MKSTRRDDFEYNLHTILSLFATVLETILSFREHETSEAGEARERVSYAGEAGHSSSLTFSSVISSNSRENTSFALMLVSTIAQLLMDRQKRIEVLRAAGERVQFLSDTMQKAEILKN